MFDIYDFGHNTIEDTLLDFDDRNEHWLNDVSFNVTPEEIKDLQICLTNEIRSKLGLKKKKKLPKVVVNDKTVVLIADDGKKYFSRPEKGEKFDLEKGVLVCLAKYAGFTTSDILEIVEKAQIQPKKSKNKKK